MIKKNNFKKINTDLIPLDKKTILDLHGLTIDETRMIIDQEFDIISKINNNKKVIVLLHGYSKGEVLKKYIREDYEHAMIKYKDWKQNPGITYYIIREKK